MSMASVTHWFLAFMLIAMVVSIATLLVDRGFARSDSMGKPAFRAMVLRVYSITLIFIPLLALVWLQPPLPIAQMHFLDTGSEQIEQAVTVLSESNSADKEFDSVAASVPDSFHQFGRHSEDFPVIQTAKDSASESSNSGINRSHLENSDGVGVSDTKMSDSEAKSTSASIAEPQGGMFATCLVMVVFVWIFGFLLLTVNRIRIHLGTHLWLRQQPRHLPGTIAGAAADIGLNQSSLRCASEIGSPITVGLIWPTVVVPEDVVDWSPCQLKLALLHEQAHVNRRDVAWCELTILCRNFYWLLIPVWKLARLHTRLIELACDDVALGETDDGASYVDLLLQLAQGRSPAIGATLPMADASLLEQRVDRVLDQPNQPMGLGSRLSAWLVLVAFVTLPVALAATRPSFALPANSGSSPQVSSSASPSPEKLPDQEGESNRLDQGTVTTVSASEWLTALGSISPSLDVVVVLEATDNSIPPGLFSSNESEAKRRVFAVGLSRQLNEYLRQGQIAGVVTMQPYGMGYRGIEMLVKTNDATDTPTSLRIPPRKISRADFASISNHFRLMEAGEGPKLSLDWRRSNDDLVGLFRSNESKNGLQPLQEIDMSIPSGSRWWDIVQSGAQQAAKQGGVSLRVSRINPLTKAFANPFDSPMIYLRRKGSRGTLTFQRPNDWDTPLLDQQRYELELKTDVAWLSKQLVQLIQQTGDKPQRVWVWHPDQKEAMALSFSSSLASQLEAVAF